MRIRQTFYGWLDRGIYRLSRQPPDGPTRPVFAESTDRIELDSYAAKKHATILWWPPLPDAIKRRA